MRAMAACMEGSLASKICIGRGKCKRGEKERREAAGRLRMLRWERESAARVEGRVSSAPAAARDAALKRRMTAKERRL